MKPKIMKKGYTDEFKIDIKCKTSDIIIVEEKDNYRLIEYIQELPIYNNGRPFIRNHIIRKILKKEKKLFLSYWKEIKFFPISINEKILEFFINYKSVITHLKTISKETDEEKIYNLNDIWKEENIDTLYNNEKERLLTLNQEELDYELENAIQNEDYEKADLINQEIKKNHDK